MGNRSSKNCCESQREFGALRSLDGERTSGAVHLMTPETETLTHYFWANTRNFKVDDQAFSKQFTEGITATFTREDTPMIEAQQEMMGTTDLWSLRPALLSGDTAPVMARRILEKLLGNEAAEGNLIQHAIPSVEMPPLSA